MSYSRYYNPIQFESDQKDVIISQLKAELYELTAGQQDAQILNQQITLLEQKYQQLQEDTLRGEREGRQRAEQDLKTISNLRDEIELLKQELNSRNRELQEFRVDNNALQEMVLYRTNELQKVKSEVQDIQDQGKKVLDQKRNLERTLKRLKDDRQQLANENEALQNEYESLYQKQRQLDQNIKEVQIEISKIEKQLAQQTIQGENATIEIRNRQESLEQAKQRLNQNEKNLQLLLGDINQLEKLIQRATQEAKENQQLHQSQIQKVRDLGVKLNQLDKINREKDSQIDEVRERLNDENLRRLNLLNENQNLNHQIEKQLDVVQMLSDVRKDLLDEIATFQQEDENSLQLLRRQERQKDQLQRSSVKVEQSLGNISHFLNKQE